MKNYKSMRNLRMAGKKIVDRIKGKAKELGRKFGEAVGGLIPQPQPELIPIPVRNPQPRRPQPRGDYHGW
jgi:hypothetical protein